MQTPRQIPLKRGKIIKRKGGRIYSYSLENLDSIDNAHLKFKVSTPEEKRKVSVCISSNFEENQNVDSLHPSLVRYFI